MDMVTWRLEHSWVLAPNHPPHPSQSCVLLLGPVFHQRCETTLGSGLRRVPEPPGPRGTRDAAPNAEIKSHRRAQLDVDVGHGLRRGVSRRRREPSWCRAEGRRRVEDEVRTGTLNTPWHFLGILQDLQEHMKKLARV